MRFCQSHWDKLRAAIDARGLTPLVAKNGREAAGRVARREKAGHVILDDYDPLLEAHNMILGEALRIAGIELLVSDLCPVCEAVLHLSACPTGTCTPAPGATVEERAAAAEKMWIDAPADAALAFAREKGLVS